jgi:hypothetical protein
MDGGERRLRGQDEPRVRVQQPPHREHAAQLAEITEGHPLLTAARAGRLTWAEPLTTRDTVPRPTFARAATSSSVGLRSAMSGLILTCGYPGSVVAT